VEGQKEKSYEGWAIVELMGHRRLGGRVSEASMFGTVLLRIDVPHRPPATGYSAHYFGGAAIYSLNPTTEELARAVAEMTQPAPVQPWELPERRRLPAESPTAPPDEDLPQF
jgi:hypothetical protein